MEKGQDNWVVKWRGGSKMLHICLLFYHLCEVQPSSSLRSIWCLLSQIGFKDIDGLVFEAREGAQMGFTGKQVIHPTQVSRGRWVGGRGRGREVEGGGHNYHLSWYLLYQEGLGFDCDD